MYYFQFASLITPQLYVSDYWTAHDNAKTKELGITHVLSLFTWSDCVPDLQDYDIPADRRLHIDVADTSQADLLKHLEKTTAFITEAICEDKNNKVLVHCKAGVCRSPIVVCAYLVATTDMTASESLTHIKSLRRVVSPTLVFERQLERYSKQIIQTKNKGVEDVTLP